MDLSDKHDAIEEMGDPTVLDRDELAFDDIDELRERANEAEELEEDVERLEDELESHEAEREELLEGVEEDDLDELRDAEEPVVIEGDRFEELTELEEELSALFAEELSAHSPLEAEQLSDRFGPMELYESVESSDEASLVDELGDAEDHVRSGDDREDEIEELEAEEEEADEGPDDTYVEELRRLGFDKQADKIEAGELEVDEA